MVYGISHTKKICVWYTPHPPYTFRRAWIMEQLKASNFVIYFDKLLIMYITVLAPFILCQLKQKLGLISFQKQITFEGSVFFAIGQRRRVLGGDYQVTTNFRTLNILYLWQHHILWKNMEKTIGNDGNDYMYESESWSFKRIYSKTCYNAFQESMQITGLRHSSPFKNWNISLL